MSGLIVYDNLDDRREIWHLLHKLSPKFRFQFLDRCCQLVFQIKLAQGVNIGEMRASELRMRDTIKASRKCDQADNRLTSEIYWDILSLASPWSVDLGIICKDLEQIVKRHRLPRSLSEIPLPLSNSLPLCHNSSPVQSHKHGTELIVPCDSSASD
jgi:hypothetical protein